MNELVEVNNEQVVTTSLVVAETFGKEHKNVIQSIEKLTAEKKSLHFIAGSYVNSRNRSYPLYYMTKEGFLLLASSYRGKDALDKKMQILSESDMIPPSLPERREIEFFLELRQAIEGFGEGLTLYQQYRVSGYKVDGYIKELNLAIEYDEVHHAFKKHEDELRQKEITNELGCEFIRLPECNSNAKNIGIVFREVMKKQIRKTEGSK